MMKLIKPLPVILALVVIPLLIQGCSRSKESLQPNIIFLLTDDQRFDALGCMGNSEIETPRIDEIATKGLIFTNYYNTTANSSTNTMS